MAKPKRNKRSSEAARRNATTGRFEKANENTPFAQGGAGVPSGWTTNPDPKPGKVKKNKPLNIIRVSHPVEKDGYLSNAKAMMVLGEKMKAKGMPVFETRPLDLEKVARKRKDKTRDSKSKRKEAKGGQQEDGA